MTSFVERLVKLRERAGLRRYQLARLSDLSDGYIALIESGTRKNIGLDVATNLARTLGASCDYLFSGVGQPPTDAEVVSAVEAAKVRVPNWNSQSDADEPKDAA